MNRYGRLIEDLVNDYTKGNDNYPENMVKAYQLLNEFKNWKPRTTTPPAYVVAFTPRGKKDNNDQNNDD